MAVVVVVVVVVVKLVFVFTDCTLESCSVKELLVKFIKDICMEMIVV